MDQYLYSLAIKKMYIKKDIIRMMNNFIVSCLSRDTEISPYIYPKKIFNFINYYNFSNYNNLRVDENDEINQLIDRITVIIENIYIPIINDNLQEKFNDETFINETYIYRHFPNKKILKSSLNQLKLDLRRANLDISNLVLTHINNFTK
jgi:hypothetical protein